MKGINDCDVLIIGGGAAGLFCAIEAGRRGRSAVVLEHNAQVGHKILISGGGRCNFTNIHTMPEHFLSENPRFCRSALSRYTPQDFINLVESYDIAYFEKKLGQLFCCDSAKQIVNMLLCACDTYGVSVICGSEVQQVEKPERFRIRTRDQIYEAAALVVATGGLSISKLGASDLGYRLAKQFGLRVVQPRPALVPFTLLPDDLTHFAPLSGISFEGEAQTNGVRFREKVLFTHRGLSGPAILQISSYWQPGEAIRINLLPDVDAQHILQTPGKAKSPKAVLGRHLPNRLVEFWCRLYAPSKELPHYKKHELAALARRLNAWEITPAATEGFQKAEVTRGGVDTRDLSPKTMESRHVPGLYFIGEVVDVTGHLGGYNFQWAWASAYAAGQAV